MAIGLLEHWSFDEIVINQLSKDDILRKINQPVILRYQMYLIIS